MNILGQAYIHARGLLLRRKQDQNARHPEQAQKKFLSEILRKNEDTEYGKKYLFSSIRNENDFRRNVPVVEYSDLEAYIEKIKNGEKNILTHDPVFMFSLTSGTTANPKYIPITRQGQMRTKNSMQEWFARALSAHPAFLKKSSLGITGAAIEGYCAGKIPYGSASGMINSSLPSIVQKTFAVPLSVSAISNYETRYYVMSRFAVEQSLSLIVTPNPLTLIKLFTTIENNQEEIIRSIHNGWLSPLIQKEEDYLNAGIPIELKQLLRPNQRRAGYLSKELEKNGRLIPSVYAPDLSLIGCWLGGSIGFYADSLKQYLENVPLRDIGYMASEGCFTIPYQDHTPGGILALNNHYYEFIPESQIASPHPDILNAHELQENHDYKILLTNENGLYRYDINDIIRVDGFYHRTPVISFVRKSGNILNLIGEKLHLNHLQFALKKLQSCLNIMINQFRIIPNQADLCYELFLEVRPEISLEILQGEVLPAMDNYLCECNIEYAAKRKSGRLNLPRIHVMNSSWSEELSKTHRQFAKRDVQYKWPQMSSEKIDADYRHIKFSTK